MICMRTLYSCEIKNHEVKDIIKWLGIILTINGSFFIVMDLLCDDDKERW